MRRVTPAIMLIGVAAVCWAITARRMHGMDMGPGTDLGSLGRFAVVWATMSAAMMFPSLVPIALAHARASREADVSSPTGATLVFGLGYLLTWVGAGGVAYGVIQGIRSLELSWLAWDDGGPYVAGGVILAAALYELTPIKSTCLRHCRDPELLTRRRRRGFPVGLEHGGFCVGSSWALMAALFALGVMNVAWMIVVAALVAIEKLLPWEGLAIGATAVFVAAVGLGVAIVPDRVPGLTIPM
jgi:predicted metal-binding membrane protein